jgi:hypothetical protein
MRRRDTLLRHGTALLGIVLLLGLAACSSGPAAPDLRIEDAWARSALGTDSVAPPPSAAYLTLHNDGRAADTLLGAQTAAARVVELHQSFDDGGVMRMRPVDSLIVPAGGAVTLAPGGYHFMLIDVTRSLASGDTVALALQFAQSGTVAVPAAVQTP